MTVRKVDIVILLSILAASVGSASLGSAQVLVMPLGDSITESLTGHASYRYWLWHELIDVGYDVDFVGSMSGVRDGPPLYDDFDQDHEGHSGWRADEVMAEISDWATAAQPEVVLIHLGHNDLEQGQSVNSTIEDLEGIVGELRTVKPSVTVLLAQIIPSTFPILDEIPQLNTEIVALVEQLDTPQSRVIAVDQWTGFDPEEDTYDGVHPNETGERKMAARWFEVLNEVLDPKGLVFKNGFESGDLGSWSSVIPVSQLKIDTPQSEDSERHWECWLGPADFVAGGF